ncbi:putative RDD family membrane protein YckC [Dysgonomonas sp. PH5-45]|uniref:RDD family protein n=1 Tax=unclassified Dysgonomonas TaxID=2630389 RepID=UPI002473B0C3|nr:MULTISPECIES: RDD family protein [unclassified Dysgonomonas]MDH6354017.1 putative RDD family membrane protein YckC [Dysgonomonas sp. PH5-45]MDH6386919.1 putative RDD family membrane protein YckC [Dysgonomonas sp. PH5-37]
MAIQIETTQNVVLEQEPAGVGLRIAAYLLDWVILLVWYFGVFAVLIYSVGADLGASAGFVILFLMIVPLVFYDLLFEILWNGQTPGKKIMSIRVVNVDGTKPSLSSFLVRWLFRLVDFAITYNLLAFIMILSTKNSQRLGDYLAGTTVVNLKATQRDQILSLPDLEFHENYTVAYPDVMDKLDDKDIRIIRSAMNNPNFLANQHMIEQLTSKVKSVTGYEYQGSNYAFLKKIVDDYNYLSVNL